MGHEIGIAALALACTLTGCAASGVRPEAVGTAGCPASLADAVSLTASVAQVPVADGIGAPSGSVSLIAGVGRRILLSAEVAGHPRIRLLENSLQVYTFGGTLAGWAQVDRPAGAGARESIQVSGDYLRIAPFVPGQRLRTYTQSVDVVVLPGGEPASQLALRPGRMWDETGRPTAPAALEIALSPIQHMTVLEVVNASAQFDFTAQHRSGAHERWECAVQSDFQLVDHASVLPRLWILRPPRHRGGNGTLALYKPTTGAFPIIFLDPATAAGFARWLGETHASRIADLDIGWMAAKSATGFDAASGTDLSDLVVRQLGSD